MPIEMLKNKPLVEAIFELRWELKEVRPHLRVDPHYKVLIGRVYERLSDEYPVHQELPTAMMPDAIAAYTVQHQFRKGKGQWPLVQIGPGIITLNDTDRYIWSDFESRIHLILDALFQAYPGSANDLRISGLLLRYIDAVTLDYLKEDVFDFLKQQLKVNVVVDSGMFDDTGVGKLPLDFNIAFSFPSAKPKGAVGLRFIRGKKGEADALVWETLVHSVGQDAPTDKEQITAWVKDAHSLTHDWFFKMIEGELLERFK